MKIAGAAALVLLLTSATTIARAGRSTDYETTVDMAAGLAYGSLVDTRRSADSVQYVECNVSAEHDDPPRVLCSARSTTAGPLTCSSSRPGMVAVAQGLTDVGFVRFECAGHELTKLYVGKGSRWVP